MNPASQVFGGFAPPGSPVASRHPSRPFADDNTDDGEDGYEQLTQGDSKRRRIARACDMCRKKKIKCDGKAPKCSHCMNYKTECHFTIQEKKRNPPKGAKYIEGLENRLGRMESLLRLSGLLSEEDGDKTDLGTLEKRLADRSTGNGLRSASNSDSPSSTRRDGADSVIHTPQQPSVSSPPNAPSSIVIPEPHKKQLSEREVEALADQMCSLVTNSCGESRYIGSSSGFSIFSPKGIQWVNEKTGDTSFQDMISNASVDDAKWNHWKPEVYHDIFVRRTFKALPPRHEALALLKDYFENFNCMFPLFHEPTFMHLVDKHYSMEPYDGSGWWASLNVALAIAHRLRVMSNQVPQDEDRHAWGYLKNALAVQTELTMRNTDLLSVQALLGMALFLCGTPNPQPSFFLVSAAIRLAHSIGLHKKGSGFGLNEVEVEQRKRVFWIAYILDKDICLRSGRPPVQDDDDMNVELPSEDPGDNIGNVPLADGKGKINLFRLNCTFAVIQAKVYKQLYSVKASRQSDGELLNTIGDLDRELEEWKEEIPVDFRPEHEIKGNHTPLILHVVVLHFAYYNCLTTIHRMSVHHGYWTSRLSNYAIQGLNARPLNPRVFVSAALVVNAARTSVSLIKYIPQGDYACVWLILYYPVSALVTLFANILQNPQDTRARSDLKLMNSVITFLSMLCAEESNGSVRRMLSVCAEFERIAKVALDKAEREIKGRGKRKHIQMQTDRENATQSEKSLEQQQIETQASYRLPVPTPNLRGSTANSTSGLSPATSTTVASEGTYGTPNFPGTYSEGSGAKDQALPPQSTPYQPFTPYNPGGPWSGEFTMPSTTYSGELYPQPDDPTGMFPLGFSDMGGSDVNISGSFQQPFVPQDLWQMPMTLEWDWADVGSMSGAGFDDYLGPRPDTNGGNIMQGEQSRQ
ncbi:hypothetical protein LTR66_009480 [Elasticomyces elasticus]|nr:hypothetical protein LTR66_009480 [Elasticomyces elasticus]